MWQHEARCLSGLFCFRGSAVVAGPRWVAPMIVSAGVPEFLPYLGFWNRLFRSDVFIALDSAKFRPRHYQNRNRVRTENGWTWFSLPVRKSDDLSINTVQVSSPPDVDRAWAILEAEYRGRADFWGQYAPEIKAALKKPRLLDVNMELIRMIANWLNIKTRIVLASDVTPFFSEDAVAVALASSKKLGADKYLTGSGSVGTLPFRSDTSKLEIVYQEFVSVPYPQIYSGWQPRMSVVDCLLTHGAKYTKEVATCGW